MVYLRGQTDSDISQQNFGVCRSCTFRGEDTECQYQNNPAFYLIPMNIAKQFYGFVVLQIGEWIKLADFKPAAHNFAIVIATRIENSEHETAIKEALRKKEKENEILLREVHHRTRNNLNVVTSLLGMQLFRGLTEQIQGKISIDRSCGTTFTIVFSQAG